MRKSIKNIINYIKKHKIPSNYSTSVGVKYEIGALDIILIHSKGTAWINDLLSNRSVYLQQDEYDYLMKYEENSILLRKKEFLSELEERLSKLG